MTQTDRADDPACYDPLMETEGPDIVVVAQGRRLLAVEVKATGDLARAVDQLSRTMLQLPYPVGLVIVAGGLVVLRRDFGTGSIATVGTFSTSGVPALEPPAPGPSAGLVFEARVRQWLESLRSSHVVNALPRPLFDAVADWVVPAVAAGEVRVTGPRPALARVG